MAITDPDQKLAVLLDYAGDDVHDDYETLTIPPAAEVAEGENPPEGNDMICSQDLLSLSTTTMHLRYKENTKSLPSAKPLKEKMRPWTSM